MNYRPPNWEEIVLQHYPYCNMDTEERRAVNDFEAGADAILTYLLSSGITFEPGWEVFILNEEAKDGK